MVDNLIAACLVCLDANQQKAIKDYKYSYLCTGNYVRTTAGNYVRTTTYTSIIKDRCVSKYSTVE